MHLELSSAMREAFCHTHNRSDANAARKQQGLFGWNQWKMVSPRTDPNLIAFRPLVVDRNRAATGSRVAQYANHIAMLLLRIVAQGILPDQARLDGHIDMRASGKRWQR